MGVERLHCGVLWPLRGCTVRCGEVLWWVLWVTSLILDNPNSWTGGMSKTQSLGLEESGRIVFLGRLSKTNLFGVGRILW